MTKKGKDPTIRSTMHKDLKRKEQDNNHKETNNNKHLYSANNLE